MAATSTTTTTAATSVTAGVTSDIGALANLTGEILKAGEQVQTELNTPAMQAGKVDSELVEAENKIKEAVASGDQKKIQEMAAQ